MTYLGKLLSAGIFSTARPKLRIGFRASCLAVYLMALAAALLPLVLSTPAPAQTRANSEYRLHPQDRLLLRVVRWDPEQDVFVSLDGLVGEYTLSANGMLVLPLLGPVTAAGQTPQALSRTLARKLDALLNLSPPPRVGVDVVGHLPVYVLGEANAPGAYPYHPAMTVEQALALAGGLATPAQAPADLRPGTLPQLAGEMRLLMVEIAHREDEQKRLHADLADLDGTTDDATPMDPGSGLNANIRTATSAARKAQQDRIRELQSVLGQQIDRMSAQIELRGQQIKTARDELDAIAALKKRGLVNNERVSNLTNALNNLTSARLQLEIARLTARQQLNRAERDGLALTDETRSRTLLRLNQLQQDIDSLEIRLDTLRARHAVLSVYELGDALPEMRLTAVFRVTRNGADGPTSLTLTATEALLPGDTIRVERQVTPPATQDHAAQLSTPASPLQRSRQPSAAPLLSQAPQ